MLNEEINSENYRIEIIKNNIKDLKNEIHVNQEDISHIRHLILKTHRESENLKKSIVKQVKKYKFFFKFFFVYKNFFHFFKYL
jgi:hypothetical protein